MYQEKFFITSGDVDDHFDLKLSSIFTYFQIVSTNHSELLGLGKKETWDKGMCWVITRMKVVIYKLPKMLDTVIVKTHPGEIMSFLFPRFYQIYNEDGELLVAGSACWTLLDANTHKVIVKPVESAIAYPSEKHPDDISLPERVIGNDLSLVDTRRVRYSEIDLNRHVNNVKYIEFVIDTHDVEFFNKHYISEIVINFEREIMINDEVKFFSNGETPEIIVGEVDGVRRFSCKIAYSERK